MKYYELLRELYVFEGGVGIGQRVDSVEGIGQKREIVLWHDHILKILELALVGEKFNMVDQFLNF